MLQGFGMAIVGFREVVDGCRQLEISNQVMVEHGEIRHPVVIYMASEFRGHRIMTARAAPAGKD